MKSKMKSAYKYLTLVGLILVLVGIFFFIEMFLSGNVSKKNEKKETHKLYKRLLLIKSARELESFFRDPINHKWWPLVADECLKKYHLSEKESYRLSCSGQILQCLYDFKKIKNKPLIIERMNGISYEVRLVTLNEKYLFDVLVPSNNESTDITHQAFGIKLALNQGEEKFDAMLENNCHEVFLDERYFAYGEKKADKNSEIYFDTIGKKYFIDVHLMTKADYNYWLRVKPHENLSMFTDHKYDFEPVTHLKLKQMQDLCSFYGKQIFRADLFDAATFIPFEMREKTSKNYERGSYYWVKKNSEAWIVKNPKEINEKNCKLIYGEECKSKFPQLKWGSEPTWAGLKEVMGGVFEYVYNPIDSKENLRASSFYFPLSSSWHKLGKRAFWDGEGHDSAHFNFGDGDQLPMVYKGKNLEVGFRCMREVSIK